jgi:hypothetical protein
MREDFLDRAQEQAEQSEAPVRTAALLRISRVKTAFDRDRARRTFRQALYEARQLAGPVFASCRMAVK